MQLSTARHGAQTAVRCDRRARCAVTLAALVMLTAPVCAEDASAPAVAAGVAVPYLPSFANAGFVAAIKARPAGAEFRDSAGLAAVTEAGSPGPPSGRPPARGVHDHHHKVAVPKVSEHSHGKSARTGEASEMPRSLTPDKSDAQKASLEKVQPDKAWPRLTGPALARVRGQTQWSAADIVLAKARCAHILRSLDAVTIPEPPLREGECGAPAPVRLVSVGRKPQVALSPPALLTCDMVQALHDWMKKDVQPAARKTLRSEITQIEVMSDYSCRNAYGRARTRLSQHGYANALDVRGFVTAKGETVAVLDNWGRTGREIAALHARQRQIAAQRAAKPHGLPQPPAQAVADGRPSFTPRPIVEPEPSTAQRAAGSAKAAAAAAVGIITRATIVDGITPARTGLAGTPVASPGDAFGLGMSRLGGPKPVPAPAKTVRAAMVPYAALPPDAVPVGGDARKALFLRQIHAGACRTFGTVLGPEANNAHRNHLHIDMALRATGAFCE